MYCPRCGEEVPEEAVFCSKCGNRLKGGGPRDEKWKDELNEAAEEITRAFQIAAEEIGKAFESFRETHQYKGETIRCPRCGEMSAVSANFCYNCGKKIDEKTSEAG